MKLTDKELLDALNDPETLKRFGLQKTGEEIDEILAPVDLPEDATPAQIAKAYAERDKKLSAYMKNMKSSSKEEARKVLEDDKMTKKKEEVDAFLKAHPSLETNKELLEIVAPLYEKNGDLEKAFTQGCKVMDLNPATGEPLKATDESEREQLVGKRTQLKTDEVSKETLEADSNTEKAEPKSIRDVLIETSNKLAAEGKNPYRETT